MTVSVQWNPTTAKIRIGDMFSVDEYFYRVVDRVTSEIDINRAHGVLG
jgi:hypothetical protein